MSALIYDYNPEELSALLADWGEPAYRSRQIWDGLFRHFWQSPSEFTTLPKSLRENLENNLNFMGLEPARYLNSADGQTRKTLFRLEDGQQVEAVLMRYDDITGKDEGRQGRRTLCISTQAGCAMGCSFCATGQMGFKRHLSSGEIVAQVMYYARLLNDIGEKVTNIVLMGMGEPFHNYDNTMKAIDCLNDAGGYNLGARRFTISTVGLVPEIRRFADENRQINLAVSLHASEDEVRAAMMPINKKYNIDEVLDACRYYIQKTNRRVSFEWALIRGINDTRAQASRLAARLQGLLCHVNAIPLNPTTGYQGQPTDPDKARQFKETLERSGIPCSIRMRRGIDIQAGCGQLASRTQV
ncbi:MAG: 23S rRNA (adenine(2503)-C(2))-methyltransferase RlmN [Anaerolineales bacterium]|nr:23S rRNA (adenine(2503)-C(2))-methyltransferase RlmN [Anaerolineales bacterium]